MEKQTSKFVNKLLKNTRTQYSKAKRTYTCRTLKELIKAYRACTTSDEERALVKKESAHIRDLFKEGDTTFRRRNIAKLLFFRMNGYDTNFGMTECVKLCASDKFSDKRVAYLGLMLLVDESEAILMLITNSLKRDLNSSDPHSVGLALTVLADLASADMARDLLPEIEKLLESSNAYLRRKAALASVRAVRKLPSDETPNILASVPRLFEARKAGAPVAGTALVMSLARQSPANIAQLRATTFPAMLGVLKELLLAPNRTNSGSSNVVSGVRNPFMQIKVLEAIRKVGQGAPREAIDSVSDVLAQVAANTDSSKIIGTAVLYECVRTIVSLNTDPSLYTLAVGILGRFLSHKDPNVRHIALQELVKVVSSGRSESNVDQYRATITECLNEADPTIKHRALELLHAIVDGSNATQIADRFVSFLAETEDVELRESACRKLCDLIDRFAPSPEWRVDMFMRALKEVDMVLPESLVVAFLAWVSTEPAAGVHAARNAYYWCLLHAGKYSGARGSEADPSATRTVASVLDPFDSLTIGGPAAPPPPEEPVSDRAGETVKSLHCRRPRLERVSLCVFAEYGDSLVGASAGAGAISADEAISCVERVLKASAVGVTSFSQSGLALDIREDTFGQEVSLVREAAMSALAKLAARLTFMSQGSSSVGLGASAAAAAAAAASGPQPLGVEGPQGLLALTYGSSGGSPTRATGGNAPAKVPAPLALAPSAGGNGVGLGTDLLAGLGIGDSPPRTSAMVANSEGSGLFPAAESAIVKSGLMDEAADSLLLGSEDAAMHPLLLRVRRIFAVYRQSADLETQQRACEYSGLLSGNMASLRALAFSRLPPMDYAAISERLARANAACTAGTDAPDVQAPFAEDLLLLLEEDDIAPGRKAASVAGPADLLALPSTEPATDLSGPSMSGVGASTLEDLLGGSGEMSNGAIGGQSGNAAADGASKVCLHADVSTQGAGVASSAPASEASPNASAVREGTEADVSTGGYLGSATIFRSDGLNVSCDFFKDAGTPTGETRSEYVFSNVGTSTYSEFVFQLAVPKYMQTNMKPATSGTIVAGGNASQTVILSNSMHGSKSVQLRYRIQYAVGDGGIVREQGAVSAADLPPGLS